MERAAEPDGARRAGTCRAGTCPPAPRPAPVTLTVIWLAHPWGFFLAVTPLGHSRLRKCVLSKGAPQMFWRKQSSPRHLSGLLQDKCKAVIVVIVIRKLGGHLDLLL